DPANGVNYPVISQTPEHLVDSVRALANTPLSTTGPNGAPGSPQLLGNVASITRGVDPALIDHYSVQRVINVNCAVAGRDLGGTATDVQRAIDNLGELPPGTKVAIRGRSQAMRTSFATMGQGILLAVVLVYLLMVANFQSWLEPFIILLAVPGALAGVLWTLVLTGSTINVQSLMGAIMAVGVGVANGNLLITFANDLREEGYNAPAAALEAGGGPPRPLLVSPPAPGFRVVPRGPAPGGGAGRRPPPARAAWRGGG